MIAHCFRSGECDLIYSADSDMSALCGPNCLSICSFGIKEENNYSKAHSQLLRINFCNSFAIHSQTPPQMLSVD